MILKNFLKTKHHQIARKRSKSILSYQKPRKREIFSASKIILFFSAISLGLLVLSHNGNEINTSITRIHFDDSSFSLSSKEKRFITKKIKDFLSKNHEHSLSNIAANLKAIYPSKSISILKVSDKGLVLKIEERSDFAVIEINSRYHHLSESGEILQLASNEEADSLPKILGINPNFFKPIRSDQYNVDKDSNILIKESINLALLLEKENIHFDQIEYELYRGFRSSISDQSVTYFGRKPFKKKVRKLRHTLEHLRSKGISASKIELDYNGKTFITEKKLKI